MGKKEMSTDDEVRLLHEAYQFLVRKYRLQSPDEDKESENDKKSTDPENEDLVLPFPVAGHMSGKKY